LRESALYAPTFDKKLPRLLQRDYANPNFPAKHLLKDVRLIHQEAAALGLDTSSLNGITLLLKKTITQGLAESDYSALYNAVNPPA
jgi:3-hydroxyisobutyrate dehydrogenase